MELESQLEKSKVRDARCKGRINKFDKQLKVIVLIFFTHLDSIIILDYTIKTEQKIMIKS